MFWLVISNCILCIVFIYYNHILLAIMHKKRTNVLNKRSTLYDVFDILKAYKCTMEVLKIAYKGNLCNMYSL